MNLIDLQLHSTYSDGYYTPTEVAQMIKKHGIKIASLTDHNTVSGLHEFAGACEDRGIKPIPGLELYARDGGSRFNLLWYNFNATNPALHNLLRDSQISHIFLLCHQSFCLRNIRASQIQKALHKPSADSSNSYLKN